LSGSAFADTSADVFRPGALWRAARPLLVLLGSAVVAAVALHPGWTAVAALVAIAVPLAAYAVAQATIGLGLPDHPERTVLGLELELVSQLLWVVVALALAIFVAAEVTDHYQGKIAAYFTGLLAGGAVGYFSQEIFKPAQEDSWQAMHFRRALTREYQGRFRRLDPVTREWDDRGGVAIWAPDGPEADALSSNQFTADGVAVRGWDHEARCRRARVIANGLRRPV
jgi:hypothetical protein